jgi:two-component sensor histidine kinase
MLHWREIDGPPVKTPTHQGFGTRVIERIIGQLKGKARFDWHADGLVCEIILQA